MLRTSCLILIKSLPFSGGKFICPNCSYPNPAVCSKLAAEAPRVVRHSELPRGCFIFSWQRGPGLCLADHQSWICALLLAQQDTSDPDQEWFMLAQSTDKLRASRAGQLWNQGNSFPPSFSCLLCTFASQSNLSTFNCGQVHWNKQGTDFLQDWGPGLQTFRWKAVPQQQALCDSSWAFQPPKY